MSTPQTKRWSNEARQHVPVTSKGLDVATIVLIAIVCAVVGVALGALNAGALLKAAEMVGEGLR